jgi:hypothetical protein
MDSAFILKAAVGSFSFDDRNHLFETADTGWARADEFDAPSTMLGILGVHPKELGRKQRSFLSPGSGTDFQEGVLLVP